MLRRIAALHKGVVFDWEKAEVEGILRRPLLGAESGTNEAELGLLVNVGIGIRLGLG